MQIQAINNSNYNQTFGNLMTVKCINDFSIHNKGHAKAVNDVVTSKAFEALGEQYNFDAIFDYTRIKTDQKIPGMFGLCEQLHDYSLTISPVEDSTKLKGAKVPNLPIEFRLRQAFPPNTDDKALADFRDILRSMTLKELNWYLENALDKEEKELKKKQEIPESERTIKEIIENAVAKGISIIDAG